MHTITFSHEKDTLTIFVERDIDHHNAAALRTEIDRAIELMPAREVVLDFDSVEFMDSSGIGMVLGRYKKTAERGAKLHLRRLNSRCRRLAELSGILQLVDIID